MKRLIFALPVRGNFCEDMLNSGSTKLLTTHLYCQIFHRPVRKRTQTITIVRPAGTVASPATVTPPSEVTTLAPQPIPVSPKNNEQIVATPPAWFWQPSIPVAPNFPESTTALATMLQTEPSTQGEAFHMLSPTGPGGRLRGCPPLPAEAGVQVRCYFAKLGKVFNCNKMRSPISTEATYTYVIIVLIAGVPTQMFKKR